MKTKTIKAAPRESVWLSIDPSPTGTAVVAWEDGKPVQFYFCTETKGGAKRGGERALLLDKVKHGDENGRIARLALQRELVRSCLCTFAPSYVGFEDYVWGMGGKGGGVYQIGELGGILRLMLYNSGTRTRTYNPGTVKLAWTSDGAADKDAMVARAELYLTDLGSPILDPFLKLPVADRENVADAVAVGFLLGMELEYRKGSFLLREQPEHIIRVFNRVTPESPICLVDRPFLHKETGGGNAES